MGRRRTSNEDSFVISEDDGLGVVCDGMGGHLAGEIASRMAVELFAERVARGYPGLVAPGRKHAQVRAMAQALVRECAEEANASIHARGRDQAGDEGSGEKAGMGTTLAAVLVVQDFAVVCHVGDSRAYRVRDGVLERLTQDHSIVADKKRHPSDPRPSRRRKYVTRALGTRDSVDPDLRVVEVFPGDLFLLCSDGLTDVVTDDEIRAGLRRAGADWSRALRDLIELANRRGGPDNVTIVLAEVVGEGAEDDEDTEELPVIKPCG